MSHPPRRTASIRQGIQRLTSAVRRSDHGEPSTPATPLRHGCQSEEEDRALRQLNEELGKRHITLPPEMLYAGDFEATLLRFLRARKYNLEATLQMLTATIQWRKDRHVDQILQNPMEASKVDNIRRYKPGSYIGFDRQGRPIYVDRLSQLDVKGMESTKLQEDDIVNYHIQEMEYMGRVLLREASERAGHTIDQVVIIMDVQGVTITSFTRTVQSLVRSILSIDSDNYPETNAGTFIVNASFFFSSIWIIVERFLDKRTRQKLQLLKAGRQSETKLMEVFGPERIPDFLGGQLNYEETARAWAAKMDETMEELKRRAQLMAQQREQRHASQTPSQTDSRNGSVTEGHRSHISLVNHLNKSLGPLAGDHAVPPQAADSGFSSAPALTIPDAGDMDHFEDADEEFFTPRSSLSRADSMTSQDHSGLEAFGINLEANTGEATPPSGQANGSATSSTAAINAVAAKVNASEKDVSPVLSPGRVASTPQLPRIDESRVVKRPGPLPPLQGAGSREDVQPQCRCCIQ